MTKVHCRRLVALCFAAGVGLACAKSAEQAPHDAEPGMSGDAVEQALAPDAEPAAPAEASEAEAEEAPPALGELERELAANSSRLRALGVEMPARTGAQQAAPSEAPAQEESVGTESRDRLDKKKETQGKETQGKKAKKNKKPGRDEDRSGGGAGVKPSTPQPPLGDIAGGDATPDAAKSVRLSPEGEPEGASACVQICALSLGTCELRGAICELADRHDEEPDYRSACDQADEDCVVAEEACRACSE